MPARPIGRTFVLAGAIAIALAVAYFFLHSQDEQALRADVRAPIEEALLVQRDPETALRRAAQALESAPDDWLLHFLRGRAFLERGRCSDAIKSLLQARDLCDDDERRSEVRFFVARAHAERFLESRDRADFNLAEPDLRSALADPRLGAAARQLLGLALAVQGSTFDAAAARGYLEAAAAAPADELLAGRAERVQKALERLSQAG